MPVFKFEGIIATEAEWDTYNEIFTQIQSGECGNHFKKLQKFSDVYRYRDGKIRLLFKLEKQLKKAPILICLDLVGKKHRYDRIPYLRKGTRRVLPCAADVDEASDEKALEELNKAYETEVDEGAAGSEEQINDRYEEEPISEEDFQLIMEAMKETAGQTAASLEVVHYFDNSFLKLSEEQMSFISSILKRGSSIPKVTILNGAPGTGKSLLLLMLTYYLVKKANPDLVTPEEETQEFALVAQAAEGLAAQAVDDLAGEEEGEVLAPEAEFLYITKSEGLLIEMHSLWCDMFPSGDPNQARLKFKTYKQLIIEELKAEPNWQDKKGFDRWFRKHKKDFFKDISVEVINEVRPTDEFTVDVVYEEMRTASGFLLNDAEGVGYLKIGEKNSRLRSIAERKIIVNIYKGYLNYLKQNNLIDPLFYPLNKAFHHYKQIMVDEAQDFGTLTIKILEEIASDKLTISTDVRQQMDSERSFKTQLEQLFFQSQIIINTIDFHNTYRSPKVVVDLINLIIKLKHHANRGVLDKAEKMPIFSVSEVEGSIHCLPYHEEELLKWLEDYKNSADFVIITSEEGYEAAKKQFKDFSVFTTKSIKGLQYKKVLLYKLFSNKSLKEVTHLLEGMGDLGEAPKYDQKDSSAKLYSLEMNELITAMSRTSENLYLFDSNENYFIKTFSSKHLLADLAKEEVIESTEAEWLIEFEKLVKHENKEEAKRIYCQILKKEEKEFEAIYEGFHKRKKESFEHANREESKKRVGQKVPAMSHDEAKKLVKYYATDVKGAQQLLKILKEHPDELPLPVDQWFSRDVDTDCPFLWFYAHNETDKDLKILLKQITVYLNQYFKKELEDRFKSSTIRLLKNFYLCKPEKYLRILLGNELETDFKNELLRDLRGILPDSVPLWSKEKVTPNHQDFFHALTLDSSNADIFELVSKNYPHILTSRDVTEWVLIFRGFFEETQCLYYEPILWLLENIQLELFKQNIKALDQNSIKYTLLTEVVAQHKTALEILLTKSPVFLFRLQELDHNITQTSQAQLILQKFFEKEGLKHLKKIASDEQQYKMFIPFVLQTFNKNTKLLENKGVKSLIEYILKTPPLCSCFISKLTFYKELVRDLVVKHYQMFKLVPKTDWLQLNDDAQSLMEYVISDETLVIHLIETYQTLLLSLNTSEWSQITQSKQMEDHPSHLMNLLRIIFTKCHKLSESESFIEAMNTHLIFKREQGELSVVQTLVVLKDGTKFIGKVIEKFPDLIRHLELDDWLKNNSISYFMPVINSNFIEILLETPNGEMVLNKIIELNPSLFMHQFKCEPFYEFWLRLKSSTNTSAESFKKILLQHAKPWLEQNYSSENLCAFITCFPYETLDEQSLFKSHGTFGEYLLTESIEIKILLLDQLKNILETTPAASSALEKYGLLIFKSANDFSQKFSVLKRITANLVQKGRASELIDDFPIPSNQNEFDLIAKFLLLEVPLLLGEMIKLNKNVLNKAPIEYWYQEGEKEVSITSTSLATLFLSASKHNSSADIISDLYFFQKIPPKKWQELLDKFSRFHLPKRWFYLPVDQVENENKIQTIFEYIMTEQKFRELRSQLKEKFLSNRSNISSQSWMKILIIWMKRFEPSKECNDTEFFLDMCQSQEFIKTIEAISLIGENLNGIRFDYLTVEQLFALNHSIWGKLISYFIGAPSFKPFNDVSIEFCKEFISKFENYHWSNKEPFVKSAYVTSFGLLLNMLAVYDELRISHHDFIVDLIPKVCPKHIHSKVDKDLIVGKVMLNYLLTSSMFHPLLKHFLETPTIVAALNWDFWKVATVHSPIDKKDVEGYMYMLGYMADRTIIKLFLDQYGPNLYDQKNCKEIWLRIMMEEGNLRNILLVLNIIPEILKNLLNQVKGDEILHKLKNVLLKKEGIQMSHFEKLTLSHEGHSLIDTLMDKCLDYNLPYDCAYLQIMFGYLARSAEGRTFIKNWFISNKDKEIVNQVNQVNPKTGWFWYANLPNLNDEVSLEIKKYIKPAEKEASTTSVSDPASTTRVSDMGFFNGLRLSGSKDSSLKTDRSAKFN